MMVIENKFEISQFVYLNTDPEQLKRIITGIVVKPTGLIYQVSIAEDTSHHFEFELSEEIDEEVMFD